MKGSWCQDRAWGIGVDEGGEGYHGVVGGEGSGTQAVE